MATDRPASREDDAGGDRGTNPDDRPGSVADAERRDVAAGRLDGLAGDLGDRIEGDVRLDDYSRQLYATDASAYEVTPIGVVMPRSTDDVAAVMEYCAREGIPVLPRGGGTSLAGQAVNEAVVLDFSRYMDDVHEVDPDAATARVDAGVILEELNEVAGEYGLKFAPDPASGDRSTVGGALGNNSTGSHSLKYGKTDAYVEEVEAVLADGSVVTFGDVSVSELRERADPDADAIVARVYAELVRILEEEADEIRERYPDLKRNVSGYNLDTLLAEADGEWDPDAPVDPEGGTVNLARLLAGSEGTLAIVTEVTVTLEPVPDEKAIALLCYGDVDDAVADVQHVLEHDPAAVELIDDVLLDLASDTAEYGPIAESLPKGTNAALLVEFYADDREEGERKVAGLLADRVSGSSADGTAAGDATVAGETVETPDEAAFEAREAYAEAERKRLWKLRKAAAPILLSRTTDAKHISFIEDCAVPAEHLPEFVSRFREILAERDTFATFYAHAGPGVLHVRPLVDTKTEPGRETMVAIADAVTDLVVEFNGSVSGEHGDGRARTQWNRKLYGERLWEAFRDLKTAYDPDWLLNPGTVCGDVDMTDHLRFGESYAFDPGFQPELNWDIDNGFQGMAELCHGCGSCRGSQSTTGGVMCPTYRAAEEEITSTRGRANLLRQAMSGDLPREELLSERFADEVLDLCIGCKGCSVDCPSEVDLAKLKAEVTHARHEERGASLRDRLFANIDRLSAVGSALAPLSNVAPTLPGSRRVLERAMGIAADRSLPRFHRESLRDWFESRGGSRVPAEAATRKAVLFPDTHTNYNDPAVGKAAVAVLEAAGVRVELADETGSGRPPLSKGFIDVARERARTNVDALAPRVADGWDVVVVEPSDAVMFQSDLLDLLSGPDAESVAANTYGVCEYLDAFRLDGELEFDAEPTSLTYHGHCHQKATRKDHHAVGVLRRAGYEVDPLDSGCCGMAGSFGYEAEHFELSRAIGSILFEQIEASDGDAIVAPGASCRTQIGDGARVDDAVTPIEMVARAIRESNA